jgi:hypothetical protein
MARWPTRGDADKTGEGGNVDEGFDPLHAGQSASRRFVPKWLVCLVGDRAGTRAFSVLIESEPKVWIPVLTRFLHANRVSTSLENALFGGFLFALQQPDQIGHAGRVLALAPRRRGRVVLPAPAPDQS